MLYANVKLNSIQSKNYISYRTIHIINRVITVPNQIANTI